MSKRKREVLSDFQGTNSLDSIISSAQVTSELFSNSKWLQSSNLKTIANHGHKISNSQTQITKITQQPIPSAEILISQVDSRTKIAVPFLLKTPQTTVDITSQQKNKFLKKLKKTINRSLNTGSLNNGSLNNGSLNNGSLNNGSLNNGSLNNGSLNTGSLKDGTINKNSTEEFILKPDICQNYYTISNQRNKTNHLNLNLCSVADHILQTNSTEANKIMEYSLVEELNGINKKKKFINQQDTDELNTIFPYTSQLLCDVTDKTQATTTNLIKNYDFINEVEYKDNDFENTDKHQENTNHNNCNCNTSNMNTNNVSLEEFLLDLFKDDNNQTLIDKDNKAQTFQKTSELLDNSIATNTTEDYLFPDEESFVITEEGISTQDYELYLQQGCYEDDQNCYTTDEFEKKSSGFSMYSMSDSSSSLITTKENPLLSEVALFRCISPMLTEDDCIPIQYLHNKNNESKNNLTHENIKNSDNKMEMLSITDLNKTNNNKCKDFTAALKRKSSVGVEGTVIDSKKLKRNDKLQIDIKKLVNSDDNISTPDLCDFVLELENQHCKKNSLYVKENKHDCDKQNKVITNISNLPNSDENAENYDNNEKYKKTFNTNFDFSPSSSLSPQSPQSPSVVKIENPPSVQSNYSDDYWASTSISLSTAPSTPLKITKNHPSSILDNSNETKKRRGRPPKIHSNLPDPEEMRRLSETERRYREQRFKNNEASRQSRQNKKRKEEEKKEEETILRIQNEQLKIECQTLQILESKLKKALSRKIGK